MRSSPFTNEGSRASTTAGSAPAATGRDSSTRRTPMPPTSTCSAPGSAFQRISTARTSAGERRLAAYLLAAAEPETIRERQEAVGGTRRPARLPRRPRPRRRRDRRRGRHRCPRELGRVDANRCNLGHREQSESCSPLSPRSRSSAGSCSTSTRGSSWSRSPSNSRLPGPWGSTSGVSWRAWRAARSLEAIATMLSRIEREPFESPILAALVAPPRRRWTRRVVADRGRQAERGPARMGPQHDVRAVRAAVPLDTQVALSVESWRRRNGREVRAWIDAVAEFEALASFAAYTFENPDDPFPEVVEGGDPLIEATGLGHPLLPKAACVRNDVRLGGELRVLVVSGSNMSGKSTLLRALGRQRRCSRWPGRRSSADCAAALAALDRRDAEGAGLAPGRHVAVLRRDPPNPAGRGPDARRRAAALPARRGAGTARTRTTASPGPRPSSGG